MTLLTIDMLLGLIDKVSNLRKTMSLALISLPIDNKGTKAARLYDYINVD